MVSSLFYGQSEQLAYVRLPGLSAGLPGPPAKARLGRVQDQLPEHVLWEMPGLVAGAVKVGADERPLTEPGVTDRAEPRGQCDATLGPSASEERAALIPLHCKGPWGHQGDGLPQRKHLRASLQAGSAGRPKAREPRKKCSAAFRPICASYSFFLVCLTFIHF